MIARRSLSFVLAMLSVGTSRGLHAADVPVAGTVAAVTLYRDSAVVTRTIELPAGKGTRELVVAPLPDQLVVESVFAEASEGVAVRAVRVVSEPITGSSLDQVQKFDDKIAELQREIAEVRGRVNVLQQNLQSLEQVFNFTAQSGRGDLNHGVLDADSLTAAFTFAAEARSKGNEELLALGRAEEDLNSQVSLLTRERAKLVGGSPQSRYLARVFVEVDDEAAKSIRLNYAVAGCAWSPQMSWEGQSDAAEFSLRYAAVIQQVSGEDWNNVKLTLSTASPSVNASGPRLAPLRIAAVEGAVGPDPFGDQVQNDAMTSIRPSAKMLPQQMMGMAGDESPLKGQLQSLRQMQRSAEEQTDGIADEKSSQKRDALMNRFAGEMQELELRASAQSATGLAADAQDEVASQTYALPQPVSLSSRREQQLVEIASEALEGKLIHVATPLLSSFAYREAELTNNLSIGLLRSPATVYLDDRFVGRMNVPTTASGQRLQIGFGADAQVRTRRELLEKIESVQGGNRRLEFTYRLVVSNFKSTAVPVRVIDRIPIVDQSRQTSVTLEETSVPISDDKLYQRVQRPLGLLRFDVDLPAGATGADAMDITYRYTVEFDRNRQLEVAAAADGDDDSLIDAFMGGGMGK